LYRNNKNKSGEDHLGPVKPPDPNDANLSDIPVQKAQVLWNEYKYRHDLVWRVLFQVTAAAVILSVAPYLAPPEVVYYPRLWLLAAPVLAFVLVVFSIQVVNTEQNTLDKIRSAHRCLQNDLFEQYRLCWPDQQMPVEGQDQQKPIKKQESSPRSFTELANFYLRALAVLSAANTVVCALFWIYSCVACSIWSYLTSAA